MTNSSDSSPRDIILGFGRSEHISLVAQYMYFEVFEVGPYHIRVSRRSQSSTVGECPIPALRGLQSVPGKIHRVFFLQVDSIVSTSSGRSLVTKSGLTVGLTRRIFEVTLLLTFERDRDKEEDVYQLVDYQSTVDYRKVFS